MDAACESAVCMIYSDNIYMYNCMMIVKPDAFRV